MDLIWGYAVISLAVSMMDIVLGWFSYRRNNAVGRNLGSAFFAAAAVDLSYLVCVSVDGYFHYSLFSSVYFILIDLMLCFLLQAVAGFTHIEIRGIWRKILAVLHSLITLDCLVLLINPFHEIAIGYSYRKTAISCYDYNIRLPYRLHLILCYLLTGLIVLQLVYKMLHVPDEYRSPYVLSVLSIAFVVAINAIYLFLPGQSLYNLLDYSILAYSFSALFLYLTCFSYTSNGMLERFKGIIFENIDQGIILFDYADNMILYNERMCSLIESDECVTYTTLSEYIERFDLDPELRRRAEPLTFRIVSRTGRALRCDYRVLRNEKDQLLGKLFVVSDATLETDLLTGFRSWEAFKAMTREHEELIPERCVIAVCDINGLLLINEAQGRSEGDRRIRELADAVRAHFPMDSLFVRGHEAMLIVLVRTDDEDAVFAELRQIDRDMPMSIQYATSRFDRSVKTVREAIESAIVAMRNKKLLDDASSHSGTMNTLIRALQECDKDTEEHVSRTRAMGARLATRLNLTDEQQTQLSLLCLLHDIGKIGIPLEILNKPGKLSPAEKTILRSHVQKGYQIVTSSHETESIGEMVLHHHENWDGTGYPDGIMKESIPLLSRIIAVVDAYDAMTNDRSYRASRPPEKAIAELKRCAGTQFDPHIVSEFIALMQEDGVEAAAVSADAVGTAAAPMSAADTPISSVHSVRHSRIIADTEMNILDADESFEELTGYPAHDVARLGLKVSDLVPELDRFDYICAVNRLNSSNDRLMLEHRLKRRDGAILHVFTSERFFFDSAERAERHEILMADSEATFTLLNYAEAERSREQRRREHLEDAFRHDSLTGLLNHEAFKNDVDMQLLSGETRTLLLMMDIDHFKQYNDTFGHFNGDAYLKLMARSISTALRSGDLACRMGGDEFAAALFFKRDVPEEVIRERAGQIFKQISASLAKGHEGGTISMGAAIAEDGMSFNRLYIAADKQLYASKEAGRNRISMA